MHMLHFIIRNIQTSELQLHNQCSFTKHNIVKPGCLFLFALYNKSLLEMYSVSVLFSPLVDLSGLKMHLL